MSSKQNKNQTVVNLLDELTAIAESAVIAEPSKRGGGGGGQAARTTEQLEELVATPETAPKSRRNVNGAAHSLDRNQVAAVIVGRNSVGGAAFAIAHQSRNHPEFDSSQLARAALDYRPNRDTVTGITLECFEGVDARAAQDQHELVGTPIEFCIDLFDREAAVYSAFVELVKRNNVSQFSEEAIPATEESSESAAPGDSES